ncbi:hypothetical protein CU098_007428 [Rhizopus stolonifer]|uniref:U6 small nuclear RNA (adenine-(43)-N(6))-methyltransferase n=1 Tax=Rhizopus stolonifer TaxID=4846 RepID=A0A367KHN3_RHIST|nr:hypothetical protein CU098_007428 [Rhizopus stolonifer]
MLHSSLSKHLCMICMSSYLDSVQIDSQGRSFIDFKDASAVKELCLCLLKKDFNLEVDFPLDTLCPAIPNRLNYILWLQDLLEDTHPKDQPVKGIDIGVGASCIYPLLGCATHSQWSFLGTEINARSLSYATKNVEKNCLQDRIQLEYNRDPNKIFLLEKDISYAFCMCNPPFYSSQEEIERGLANKELEPSAVCTGNQDEMITEGGEYGFVKRMILESLELKTKVRWYTSMIGLKRTIRPLIRVLNDQGITNYIVTRFTQGKTVRWALGWSFFQHKSKKAYQIETWRPVYQFEIELPKPMLFVLNETKSMLDDLDIRYQEDVDGTLQCTATKNTWSRAARRQRKRQKTLDDLEEPFVFSLVMSFSASETDSFLQICWLEGGNKAQFEAFWSHLKKRIEEACGLDRGTQFIKAV